VFRALFFAGKHFSLHRWSSLHPSAPPGSGNWPVKNIAACTFTSISGNSHHVHIIQLQVKK